MEKPAEQLAYMKPPEVDMVSPRGEGSTLDTESNHELVTARTNYQDDTMNNSIVVEDVEEIKSE